MPCKTLMKSDVTIIVDAVPDDIPVRGNACVSGDADFDKEVEDEILQRLELNDSWAWACVSVSVSWENLTATEHLGGCCYENEEEFRQEPGYYEDMVATALSTLNSDCKRLFHLLSG